MRTKLIILTALFITTTLALPTGSKFSEMMSAVGRFTNNIANTLKSAGNTVGKSR